MKKRIFAWVILIGFVLLLLNLIVFRFYWQLSMIAYIIIVFAFLLANGRLFKTPDQNCDDGYSGGDEAGTPQNDDKNNDGK